jgi:hypothetical protein
MRSRRTLCLAGVLLGILSGCTSSPARPYESLTSGAEPLRSQFNRDVGKVRIVIVAAPT